jgi:hypothetical protein
MNLIGWFALLMKPSATSYYSGLWERSLLAGNKFHLSVIGCGFLKKAGFVFLFASMVC